MNKVCAEPGCPRLCKDGRCRCDEHQLPRLRGAQWQRIVRLVVRRDEGRCWLCGRDGADSADHVIALVRGGTNDIDNLRAAHLPCNLRRGAG